MASMKVRRNGSSAITINNYVFVFGGNNESGSIDSIEKYTV